MGGNRLWRQAAHSKPDTHPPLSGPSDSSCTIQALLTPRGKVVLGLYVVSPMARGHWVALYYPFLVPRRFFVMLGDKV